MANVKNFGLIGVGSDLQFGKAGPRLIDNLGTFTFKAPNGSTDAALTAAGITSSAGDVTLTTGNLVLTSASANISIGGDSFIARQGNGVFKFLGDKAFIAPVGATGTRPVTGATGMIRVNNDVPAASSIEYYNGTAWTTLATGGDATALQIEVDNIEASLGTMVSTAGVWNNAALSNVTVWPTPPTDLTSALNTMASMIVTDNNLEEIFPATGAGNVIYANGTATGWLQAAPGATSGVQSYSSHLDALAAKTSTGLMVQTGAATYTSTSLVAPSRGFTITNPSGVAAAPTFVLANNLAALEGLSAAPFGYAVVTADGAMAMRQITGTSGQISVSDGNGVSTNTDIGLATVSQAATGDFVKVTLDSYGRVSGNTPVVASDVYNLVDSRYVQLGGSTMTSAANITFVGGGQVLGLPAIAVGATAATSKAYVDNLISGLQWKQSVNTISFSDVALLQATPGADLTIDGEIMKNGESTLLTNQGVNSQNGIYVAAITGTAPTCTYVLTRRADADVYTELVHASVFVAEGTHANSGWTQTNEYLTSFSGQVWVQFSGAGAYVAGDGVNISGTVVSTVISNGLKYVTVGLDQAITLDIAGALALNDTGGPLTLVLDSAGGLTQTAVAGQLGIKSGGVTNGMLANSAITLNSDSGSGSVSLGGTVLIQGTSAQGISTSASGSTYTVTVQDATTLVKGVASFNTASFSTASGAVSLKTVDVAHGGTGATTLGATQLLFGNGSSAIQSDAGLTYVAGASDTLTLGGATGGTFVADGANLTITSTATNSNIVLTPNGTGAVVIGPAGQGLLQSDAGTPLTIQGNTILTLSAVTGNVVVSLAGTSNYVNVTGPTAAQYSAAIAAAPSALTNKYYVDQAIASGASAGAVKSFQAVVSLAANGTTAIGTAMPAGATVLSVKVVVGLADAAATLSVGKAGSVAAYMATGENDTQANGMYMAETFVTEAGSVQVNATVAATAATAGSTATVIFTYQVAQ